MKRIILILALVFSINVFSQNKNPIKWSTTVVKISKYEVELIAIAIIDNDWHIYSQNVPENGPMPTIFVFRENNNYLKTGNTNEDIGVTIDDPIFGMRIKYFEQKAEFTQRIKLKSQDAFKINAVVEFMICNNTQCLPPTQVNLLFEIKQY